MYVHHNLQTPPYTYSLEIPSIRYKNQASSNRLRWIICGANIVNLLLATLNVSSTLMVVVSETRVFFLGSSTAHLASEAGTMSGWSIVFSVCFQVTINSSTT